MPIVKITISGESGVGKSTLAQCLLSSLNNNSIKASAHADECLDNKRTNVSELNKWLAKNNVQAVIETETVTK